MRLIRAVFAWVWRALWGSGRRTRSTVRLGSPIDQTTETIDTSGAELRPLHRRKGWHDDRLLPKPDRANPWEKPPRVFDRVDAARLFAPTLRTNRRAIRTLAADPEQLERYGLPAWLTEADLAQGLGVTVGALRHFSIHRARERTPHYVTFAIPKRSGGERLICAPKQRLKALQRAVLRELVAKLPVHDAAHGFVRGRSVATAARVHVGRAVVVRVDLADFFGMVTMRRVRGYLLAMGFSYPVAATLAVLCTESVRQPVEVGDEVFHVPVGPRHCVQGAPTSPGLCNAIVHKLDRRLAGLAAQRGVSYTRYADDLTFSLDDTELVGRLLGTVRAIIRSEGFEVNEAKTRVMRRGRSQRVCGVTVNDQVGLSRRERRRIRAMIHAEGRRRAVGTPSDSASAEIDGWLAYVHMLNPEQAEPLRRAWSTVRGA